MLPVRRRVALALWAVGLAACGDEVGTEDAAIVVGEPCTDDAACAQGFACDAVGGVTDVCTAHCSEDSECGTAGRCVDVGSEGDTRRTCLRTCGVDDDCPAETACVVFAAEATSACR